MRRYAWLATLGILLNVADLISTITAIGVYGATEGNPLIADHITAPWFWVAKLVIGTVAFWLLGKHAHESRWNRYTLYLGVGIYTFIVTSNVVGIILLHLGLIGV